MWIVVYVAQDGQKASNLANLLDANGIIWRIRSCGGCCEVLVPQTELSAAQELIFENEF